MVAIAAVPGAQPAVTRFNMEEISSLGGTITPMAASGDLLVASEGGGIVLFDISVPSHPRVRSKLALPGGAGTVVIDGHLMAASVQASVDLFDVADPDVPRFLAGLSVPKDEVTGASALLSLEGSRLCVATISEFAVFDVSDPSAPTALGSLPLNFTRLAGLCVNGGRAYLASASTGGGVLILSVGNPASPHEIGTLLPGTYVAQVIAQGEAVWVTHSGMAQVYRVADPSSPELVSTLGPFSFTPWLIQRGTLAAVAGGAQTPIYDVSDPFAPRLVATSPVQLGRGVVSRGPLYISNYINQMLIYDLHTLNDIRLVGEYRLPYSVRDLAVVGDQVFMADGLVDFLVADTHDLAVPIALGSHSVSPGPARVFGYAYCLAASGELAFVAGEKGMAVLDADDPASIEVRSVRTQLYGGHVALSGNLAYLTRYHEFAVVDVSDPSSPELRGTLATESLTSGIAASGELALVVTRDALLIVDASDPDHPVLRGTHRPLARIVDVAVTGHLAVLACQIWVHSWGPDSGFLSLVDFSDPVNPREVGRYGPESVPLRVGCQSTVAALSTGSHIELIDFSDVAHPRLVGKLDVGTYPTSGPPVLRGDVIYFGTSDGLRIARYLPPDGLRPPFPLSPGDLIPPGPARSLSSYNSSVSLSFLWEAFTPEYRFNLTLVNETDGLVAHTARDIAGTSYAVSAPFLTGALYRWQMTSSQGSAESEPSVSRYFRLNLREPEGLSPGNESHEVDAYTLTPTLRWTAEVNTSCEVTVCQQPDGDILFQRSGLTGREQVVPRGVVEAGGHYAWSVRASKGGFSEESHQRFFTVVPQPTTAPNFFEVPPLTSMDPQATSLLSADLDGDGHPDAVATGTSGVQVLFNTASGEWSAPANTPVGLLPVAAVAGDLDGDGDLDLAVVNQGNPWGLIDPPGSLSILLNRGDGTLESERRVAEGWLRSPNAIAAADFDGDGDLDLAVTKRFAPNVAIFLNRGDATFEDPIPVLVNHASTRIAAGDLDGDGAPDLAVEHAAHSSITLLLNRGVASWPLSREITLPGASGGTALGDLDGDGDLDIVTWDPGAKSLQVLWNTGAGLFSSSTEIALGVAVTDIELLDLGGDHTLDIAALSETSDTVAFVTSRGDGQFGPVRIHSGPRHPVCGAVFDWNWDGQPDLLLVNSGSQFPFFTELPLRPDGGVPAPRAFPLRWRPTVVRVSDLNRDGIPDAVVASGSTDVLIGTPDGGLHRAQTLGAYITVALLTYDLDGDNVLDLVSCHSGGVRLWHGVGDGTFASPEWLTSSGVTTTQDAVAAADLDGDGDLDLAACNRHSTSSYNATIELLLNTGGHFTNTTIPCPAAPCLAAADLDGDGDVDLAAFPDHTWPRLLMIFVNDGMGRFTRHTQQVTVGYSQHTLQAVDVDRDGAIDLVGASIGDVDVFHNDGALQFTRTQAFYIRSDRVLLTDVNLDGFPDLILVCATSPPDSALRVGLNDRAGHFAWAGDLRSASAASCLDAADMDRDGDIDLVTGNVGGVVSVVRNLLLDQFIWPDGLTLR